LAVGYNYMNMRGGAMDIDGLDQVVKHKRRHSMLTHFIPLTGGPRLLALETLSSGKARIELLDDGAIPQEGQTEQLFIEFEHDSSMVERMVRAMAVYHFGLPEAAGKFSDIDAHMLSKGFELGFEEGGKPVWIRLHSAMNVVLRNEAEDALPVRRSQKISMLCIIPERNQIRFMCENLATAFRVLESGRPFKTKVEKDETEMVTMDVVDSVTVVYH
jgi:hypothetical protein